MFDSVLCQIMFNVCSFEAKNRVFEINYKELNTFKSVRYLNERLKIDVRVCMMSDLVNLVIGSIWFDDFEFKRLVRKDTLPIFGFENEVLDLD